MSLILICPHCNKSVFYAERPISFCNSCGKSLPDELKEKANSEFKVNRPVGLTILMVFLIFSCFMILCIMGMSLAFEAGTYQLNGEQVSREEFLKKGIPQMLLAFAFFGSVAFGILKEKQWSRVAALGLFIVPYFVWAYELFTVDTKLDPLGLLGILAIPLLFYSGFVFAVYYYLYHKDSTSSYFRDLKYNSNKSLEVTDKSAPQL